MPTPLAGSLRLAMPARYLGPRTHGPKASCPRNRRETVAKPSRNRRPSHGRSREIGSPAMVPDGDSCPATCSYSPGPSCCSRQWRSWAGRSTFHTRGSTTFATPSPTPAASSRTARAWRSARRRRSACYEARGRMFSSCGCGGACPPRGATRSDLYPLTPRMPCDLSWGCQWPNHDDGPTSPPRRPRATVCRWRCVKAVALLTLAVVAVSVTLPFALHPSPERDIFHTQVGLARWT